MTVEEAQEIANRVAQEEFAPRTNVERVQWGHEVSVVLPFPNYYGAVSVEGLEGRSPAQVERAFRRLCLDIKSFICAGVEKQDAAEQERMWRDNIARRLAGD